MTALAEARALAFGNTVTQHNCHITLCHAINSHIYRFDCDIWPLAVTALTPPDHKWYGTVAVLWVHIYGFYGYGEQS